MVALFESAGTYVYNGYLNHAEEDMMKSLLQQSWVLMLEMYKKIERERKELSIPGILAPDS